MAFKSFYKDYYNNNYNSFNKYNKKPNLYSINKYFHNTLEDTSITSTYRVGNEVYNIRDKSSNKILGFIGYLTSKNKLDSLARFITNITIKYKLKEYIIIIRTKDSNLNYIITKINNNIKKAFWLFNKEDLKESFYNYKTIILNHYK